MIIVDYELINTLGRNFQEIFNKIEKNISFHQAYKDQLEHVGLINNKTEFDQNPLNQIESICIYEISSLLSRNNIDISKTCILFATCCGSAYNMEYNLSLNNAEPAQNTTIEICDRIKNHFGFKCERFIIGNACAAGQLALDLANMYLEKSKFENAIVCAFDFITDSEFAGFKNLKALAPIFCDPFIKSDGMSLGEAIGCILISKKNYNNSNIFFYSSATTNDAYHLTSPEPSGKIKIYTLEQLQINDSSNIIINPHGTGTAKNDNTESFAIKQVFPHAILFPTKKFTGHCLGASSLAECMFVSEKIKRKNYNFGISNSFAFAGTNSIVALSNQNNNFIKKYFRKNLIIQPGIEITNYHDLEILQKTLNVTDIQLRKYDTYEKITLLLGLTAKRIVSNFNALKVGCIVISDTGPLDTLFKFYSNVVFNGLKCASPFLFPNTVYNSACGVLMQKLQIYGYNLMLLGSNLDEAKKIAKMVIINNIADCILIIQSNVNKNTINGKLEVISI